MPIDRTAEPRSGPSSKGRSDSPAGEPDSPEPPASARRRPSTLVLMLSGVAVALLLGVLFGLWARPELIGSTPPPAAPPPAAASPTSGQIPLSVGPPAAPEPLPRAPGRLETLPPEMAAVAPTPPEAGEAPPTPGYRTSFECATARPGAEEMVCGDPALAAADRQMARAYRRAMDSGADPDDLRQEQRDWVAIREDAALHSRRALAQVYDQRIEELNRIADTAPGPEGHPDVFGDR